VESWLTGSALDETRRRALRMLRAIDAGNQIGRRERAAVNRLGRSSLSVGILLVCAVAAAVLLVGPMAWAALPTVQTFTSVGESTFIVPDGVSHVSVAAIGAQGGAGYEGGCYADGAEVTGTLAVTAGETLYVEVGGQGGDSDASANPAGGSNGGGTGGSGGFASRAAGGGASEVRTLPAADGVSPVDSRLLVAGGGGGGGDSYGIANKQLSQGRSAQRAFLTSFS